MSKIQAISDFVNKWNKHFKTFSFLIGFVLDWIFLPNITSKYYFYIAPIYIGIIFVLILIRQVFLYQQDKRGLDDDNNSYYKINKVWTFLISFFLGSLLSYLLVYYFRSADILFSFHIFGILILCVLVNEIVGGVFFDILLFFTAITFYSIYNTPILWGAVNEKSFIFSLFLAFCAMFIFIKILRIFKMQKHKVFILYIFSIIFPLIIYVLYSIGGIPAVPLTVKDSGFYSLVIKNNPEYNRETTGRVDYSKYFFIKDYYYDISEINNQLYYYTAILSPTDVSAKVQHIWERYNSKTGEWEYQGGKNNYYTIQGGREGGYRTFSSQDNLSPGIWRVRIYTDSRLVGTKKVDLR